MHTTPTPDKGLCAFFISRLHVCLLCVCVCVCCVCSRHVIQHSPLVFVFFLVLFLVVFLFVFLFFAEAPFARIR